jgi:hypothetical protein
MSTQRPRHTEHVALYRLYYSPVLVLVVKSH